MSDSLIAGAFVSAWSLRPFYRTKNPAVLGGQVLNRSVTLVPEDVGTPSALFGADPKETTEGTPAR